MQAIAHRLAEKGIAMEEDQEIEILADEIYPRYPHVIVARKIVTVLTVFFLVYAGINIIQDMWGDFLSFRLRLAGSGATIALSLTLIVLLISEIFQGAGQDHTLDLKQGSYRFRDYHFIPSLDRFSDVLGLLGISFLAIVVGFASLYTDLIRQNSEHFSGLEEGLVAIYFSIVTFSTVGYGDIHPASFVARMVVMSEIFIALFFSLVVMSTILSWVLANKRQQQEMSIQQRIREQRKLKSK